MPHASRLPLFAALLAVVLFASACDNAKPDPPPLPHFTASVSAPVNATLKGPASVQDGPVPGTGGFVTLPLPGGSLGGDVNVTALFFEAAKPSGHTIALTHFGAEPLAPGEYDAGGLMAGFAACGPDRPCDPASLFDASMFTASYTVMEEDSLKNFQVVGGTVVLETVTEERITGRFELEAGGYAAFSSEDLRDFRAPSSPADTTALPAPTLVELPNPLVAEGTFEAQRIETGR